MARKTPQIVLDKAVAHYAKSNSIVKTGRRYGVSASVLHRELKERGIKCEGLNLYRRSIKKLPDISVVKRRYEAGETPRQIAADYDVTHWTVIAALRNAGIPRRPQGNSEVELSDAQLTEFKAMYQDGHNMAEIAAVLGVAQNTLKKCLRRYGLFRKRSARRDTHGQWRGGRLKASGGYIKILLDPSDSMRAMCDAHGYVMEHRIVMARSIGRVLAKSETVHHINGQKADNRIENLQLRQGKHGTGVAMVCLSCGSHNVAHRELK